jgi:glycosyltransferase involved in cell wall biosynthesis
MKIGITCYPTYGGSGAVATELGMELANRGHEIHFISYAQPFRLTHFSEGVFFHEVEFDRYPLFELRFRTPRPVGWRARCSTRKASTSSWSRPSTVRISPS